MGFSGLNNLSLGVDLLSLLLGFSLQSVVFLYSGLESLVALTLTNMLDSDVNSLGDDNTSDLFVDNDANSMLSNIENSAGSSVIVLEGHTLVYATVSNDVDEVSLSVSGHYSGERDGSVSSESLLEEVSSLSSISFSVRHLYYYPKYLI